MLECTILASGLFRLLGYSPTSQFHSSGSARQRALFNNITLDQFLRTYLGCTWPRNLRSVRGP